MRSSRIDLRTILLRSSLFAVMALMSGLRATADEIMLDLMLVDPTANENTYNLTYAFKLEGLPGGIDGTYSQVDTATSIGNVLAKLNVDFDSGTQSATTTGIEFTGGSMSLTDTQVVFDFGSDGTATFNGIGLGGQLDTPTPPSSVGNPSAGDFASEDYLLNLDTGLLQMTPTGNIALGLTLLGITIPIEVDVAIEPIPGMTVGETGNIDVVLNSLIGNVATYDVRLEVPVNFSNTFMPGFDAEQTLAVEGTIVAEGQFTRLVPEPSSIFLAVMGAVLAIFLVRRI